MPAKVYGTDSRYLGKQRGLFNVQNYLYLSTGLTFWLIVAFIFLYGMTTERSLLLKILLPLFMGAGSLCLWLAFKKLGKVINYEKGQSGEREVLKVLQSLPSNYAVFCDLLIGGKRGNIDYVVSGPKGFFAVEVKNWQHANGRYLDEAIEQTMRGTLQVHKYLSGINKSPIFIQGILVIAGGNNSVQTRMIGHTLLIHKDKLVDYLISQKDVAYQSQVIHLENHLAHFTSHNVV
ncbi:NERD domain-containing protein [bacterium]|nr:MAG: NERD domain-containing protein [bacterium]